MTMSRFNMSAGLFAGLAFALLTTSAHAQVQKAQQQPKAAPPPAPVQQVAASPNDTARIIAGLPVAASSPLARFNNNPAWQQHARFFDDAYKVLNERQISKIKAWGKQAIKNPQKTLYYFFSGPDYVYADAFFPQAETYILAGLEPVGRIPEINDRTLHSLPNIRASIHNTLNLSYFITSHMSSQLRAGELTGTLPILYLFISRAGKTITDVQLLNLDPAGNVHTSGQPTPGSIQGTKIVFNSGAGTPTQTLYYFSTDLSEAGAKSTGFLKFCSTFGTGDGFVKSASYLLHNNGFATVRNFLLQHVHTHVQDDTGIPYQYFDQKVWSLHPYGRYVGPIPIFQGHYQHTLNTLFIKERAPTIDFGIGYRFRINESNVLVAVKKVSPPAAVAAPKAEPAVAAPAPVPAAPPAAEEPKPASAPATQPAAPAEQKADTPPAQPAPAEQKAETPAMQQAPAAEAKAGQAETEKEKTAATEGEKKPEAEKKEQ
jgi:hypothetical protein